MAKRGGKAATRRARQRAATRQAPAPRTIPSSTPRATDSVTAADAVTSPAPAPAPVASPRPRSKAPLVIGTGSRLTEKAAAEYHYVVADLRNIAVLSGVLLALLAVAYVLVNVVGIGRAA